MIFWFSNLSPNVEISEGDRNSLLCSLKNTAPGGHIQQLQYVSCTARKRKAAKEDTPRPPAGSQSACQQDSIKGAERYMSALKMLHGRSIPQQSGGTDPSGKCDGGSYPAYSRQLYLHGQNDRYNPWIWQISSFYTGGRLYKKRETKNYNI